MYAQRDKDGNITGLFKWPNALADKEPLADNSADVAEYLERKVTPVVGVNALIKALIKKGVLTEQDLKNGNQ